MKTANYTVRGYNIVTVHTESEDNKTYDLRSIILNQGEEEPIKVGYRPFSMEHMQARSALRAVQAVVRIGRYDNPSTTVGLHIHSERSIKEREGTNLGVVGVNYEGDLPIPRVNVVDHPTGWAQLNVQSGRFYLSTFDPSGAFGRGRKHGWVDEIIMGHGLDISVLPWNLTFGEGKGLATKILATLLEPDDEKVAQTMKEVYAKAAMSRKMNRPVIKAAKNEKYGIPTEIERDALMVVGVDGATFNLLDIEPCMVIVRDNAGNPQQRAWTGSVHDRLVFQGIASKPQSGWTVEVLE